QWRNILHVVDIVCCAAILFPIVWSIRHLRQAVQTDGKAENTVRKLKLFRQFYIMVFSYIYFTRRAAGETVSRKEAPQGSVVVFLLAVALPFELAWLQQLVTEAAAAVFYVATGIKFRPVDDNPYLPVDRAGGDEDDEDEEENGGGGGGYAEGGDLLDRDRP
ncbi:unnamed protein product, partial [Phaeothamnion confervicola]